MVQASENMAFSKRVEASHDPAILVQAVKHVLDVATLPVLDPIKQHGKEMD